jgi:hypothetical protein
MDRHHEATQQAPLWISIVSVILIVGAVATALATLQRLPMNGGGATGQGVLGNETKSVVDISFTTGLAQPEGVAFSPNGARIAIIGVFTPCAPAPRQLTSCNHGLAIFNALTDDLIRVSLIEPLLGIATSNATQQDRLYVSLYGVGWTPDSAWFGLIYSVFNTPKPTTPDNLQDSGLLLINPDTGGTTIIPGDSGYFASLGELSSDHPIWDTQRISQRPSSPLLPALLYSWSNSAEPQALDPIHAPVTHLPGNADSFAPIGLPNGRSPFTIWQPGTLIGPGSSGLSGQRSAFITTFPAWSDSGARIGVFTVGLSLPTPDRALGVLSAPDTVGAPHITPPDAYISTPPRDLALTNVQASIGAYGWAQVAWSPDGSLLASITCFARQGESMELRDTLSGSLLGQSTLPLSTSDPGCRDLEQPQKLGAYPHPNLSIAWSPNGRQLVLVDTAAASLTIWQILPNR